MEDFVDFRLLGDLRVDDVVFLVFVDLDFGVLAAAMGPPYY